MKGKQIKTIKQLLKSKSVWVESWRRRVPTAFLQNMQFWIIAGLLLNGRLYKYIKKNEKTK